ncbi:hypothetical protein Lal_00022110 [Lupinus albus]|nr:hypothetical protein Lal_00022110 [Lupinus albus]
MAGITKSSSRLLVYGIFISRVIDHLDIDTSDVEKMVEDHRTTVDLDLSDEDDHNGVSYELLWFVIIKNGEIEIASLHHHIGKMEMQCASLYCFDEDKEKTKRRQRKVKKKIRIRQSKFEDMCNSTNNKVKTQHHSSRLRLRVFYF